MSGHRSPLKARAANRNAEGLRRTVTKRQTKRKLSELFATGGSSEQPLAKRLFDSYEDSMDNSLDEFNGNFFQPTKRTTSPIKAISSVLPVDLRLGTKVRVASARPFGFSPALASNNNNGDENNNADASTSRPLAFDCEVTKDARRLVNNEEELETGVFKNVRPMALLKAAGLYFQYPDGRYRQIFARLERLCRGKNALTAGPAFSCEEADGIHQEWLDSFDDLFASWKAGLRNSFYFVSPQFTILFLRLRAASLNESDETCMVPEWEHRLIVNPTTPGFRNMLKKKGIAFTLPFTSKTAGGPKDSGGSESCVSAADSSFFEMSTLDLASSQTGSSQRNSTPERENLPPLERPAEEFVSPVKPGEVLELDELLRNIGSSPSIKVPINESQDQTAARESNSGTTLAINELESIDAFYRLLINENRLVGPPAHAAFAAAQFANSSIRSLNFQTQALKRGGSVEYTLVLDEGPVLPHVPHMLHEYFKAVRAAKEPSHSLKFNVAGRSRHAGINEAAGGTHKNVSDFEVTLDGLRSRFTF
ncbi:Protein downstream neighbor of son-like protein [Aphelenchoides fujianensis]|nr:Protein downstream neighbor of son-like protein [Aphelenchoides fujianensis]